MCVFENFSFLAIADAHRSRRFEKAPSLGYGRLLAMMPRYLFLNHENQGALSPEMMARLFALLFLWYLYAVGSSVDDGIEKLPISIVRVAGCGDAER